MKKAKPGYGLTRIGLDVAAASKPKSRPPLLD
jgi:hypothetical protein